MNPMCRRNLIATSACLGAIILASAVHAAPADMNMGPDHVTAGQGHSRAFHHVRRGKGWHRGGFGHFCGKRREARTERMISVVEGLMTFNAKQATAWKDLTTAVRDGNKSMDETCTSLNKGKDRDKRPSATERLGRMETMLAARLKFVRAIRPKFDRFYATLNEKQQKAFDMFSGHRRMH